MFTSNSKVHIRNYRLYRAGQGIVVSALLLLFANDTLGFLEPYGLWGDVLIWTVGLVGFRVMYSSTDGLWGKPK